jgi:soluble lytic murein transglycosylase-like protein
MSILSELKQQKHSLDDLAKLPQSMIMQMAQRKQIMPEMVAPILSRKAEMMEAVATTKALQSAPQGMAQPTVMESLMARNAQPPSAQPMAQPPQQSGGMGGLGQMSPPPQFAGGGIIAFAEGDYVDGEDQIDPEEAEFDRHQAYLNRILSTYGDDKYASPTMARSSPQADTIVAMASPTSKRYEMERSSVAEKRPEDIRPAVKEVTKEKVSTSQPTKQAKNIPNPLSHPYAGMVAEDAKKYGVDPKVSLRLLNNETGGLKNPETAVSTAGAVGIAQFMPKTAGQYKIDPTDPKQSSDAMNRHVKHLMREYGDPQLVAIAYNWGEGNTNRWLKTGADPSRLPKETRNYLDKFMNTALAKGGEVQGYAKGGEINAKGYAEKMKKAFGYEPFHGPTVKKYLSGGEVKHFETGDLVSGDPMGMGSTEILDTEKSPSGLSAFEKWFMSQTGNPDWKIQEANRKALEQDMKDKAVKPATPVKPAGLPNPVNRPGGAKPPATPEVIEAAKTKQQRQADIGAPLSVNLTRANPAGVEEVRRSLEDAPAPVDPMGNVTGISPEYDQLMQELRESKLASAKQRKEDKAYANIMAGVATMGGESTNALVNIAKGQAAGLGMLQENRKQSAAEDARTLQMQGTVLRYKDAALLAKQAQQDRDEYRKDKLALEKQIAKDNKSGKDEQLIAKKQADLNQRRKDIENGLRLYGDSQMRQAKVFADSRYAAAKNAVLEDDQRRLMAEGDKILNDAEMRLQNDPIYVKGMNEIFADTGITFTPPKPPPPAKTISLNDMSKKK